MKHIHTTEHSYTNYPNRPPELTLNNSDSKSLQATNPDAIDADFGYNQSIPFFEIQSAYWSNMTRNNKAIFLKQADKVSAPPKYFNLIEAAQFIRRTPKAVYQLVHKNQIRVVRPQGKRNLLFRRVDLERFIESSEGVYL